MACVHRTSDNMCKKYSVDGYESFCGYNNGADCVGYTPSNADRIRSMTDEELANKFEEIQLKTVKAYGNDDLLLKGELKKYWLDWLREEAEGRE